MRRAAPPGATRRPRWLAAGVMLACCTAGAAGAAAGPGDLRRRRGSTNRRSARRSPWTARPGRARRRTCARRRVQSIARRYPSTVYADDALWLAGRILVDSYVHFGEASDKAAAEALFQRLQ